MEKIIRIFLFFCLFLSGCTIQPRENFYDFGKVKSPAQPFVGILSGRPYILVKSLDYYPYKWCIKRDIDHRENQFDVDFNHDSFRSRSSVKINFIGEDGLPVKIAKIEYNGIESDSGLILNATEKAQVLRVRLTVDTAYRDTIVSGIVALTSCDIDSVNNYSISNNHVNIGDWRIRQKEQSSIWLYILWLLTLLVILLIVAAIVYALVKLFEYLISCLCTLRWVLLVRNKNKTSNKGDTKNDDTDKRKRKIWLQTESWNDILKGFKVSRPQYVDEANLNECIWWEESQYRAAKRFARRFSRYVRRAYKENFRSYVFLHKLNPGNKRVWIGAKTTSHLRHLHIIDNPNVKIDNLRFCAHFPNTDIGRKHAQKMLNQLNDYINEHYGTF